MQLRYRHAVFAVLAGVGPLAGSATATSLSDQVGSMRPGEFAEFQTSGYTRSLLEVGSHNVLEYAAKGLWNPVDRELDFIGEGHSGGRKHLRFDEADNSWRELSDPPYFVGHAYDQQTIDPATGTIYTRAHNSRSFRSYSKSQGWSNLPSPPIDNWQVAGGVEWFPELGGFVFVDSVAGVWLFDVDADRWDLLDEPDPIGPLHNFAAYNPVHKVMVFGGGNSSQVLYKLDRNGDVSRIADTPNGLVLGPGPSQGRIVADPATGDYLAFFVGGEFYRYDVEDDRWQFIDSHPIADTSRDWYTATRIDTHGVIAFMLWNGSSSSVWLYRHTDQIPPAQDPPGNGEDSDGADTAATTASGWVMLAALLLAVGVRGKRPTAGSSSRRT